MASTIKRVLDRLTATQPTADESQFLIGVLAGMSPTKMDQALDYLDERRAREVRERAERGETP
ncbi:hypothetical protein [Nonomuraea sp. NPDC049709]|uniref:hypothetical protein n=1 Tax=Nonomuraea sp. NPDC049709 TaxID=3154736 RepID=UPI00342AE278